MGKDFVHDARYARLARLVRVAAYADPGTTCWRCGLTLGQHDNHKTGRPVMWTAGHIHDGQLASTLTIRDLLPEASTCNYRYGAIVNNRLREDPRSAVWA